MNRPGCVLLSVAMLAFLVGCSDGTDAQEDVQETNASLTVGSFQMLNGIVPHYYEYDSTENAGRKNWCAHAALKMAARYVKPSFAPTLLQIHDMFYDNSATYRANNICTGGVWCGRMLDQMYAAQQPVRTQTYIANYTASVESPHGFGLPNSVRRAGLTTAASWFAKVKDGINYNYPVITFSKWNCSYGHSYVIVGYKDTGNVSTSEIAIRDSLMVSSGGLLSDRVVNVTTFYNTGTSTDLLFIKP